MYVKNFSRKPLKNKSCFQLNIWGENDILLVRECTCIRTKIAYKKLDTIINLLLVSKHMQRTKDRYLRYGTPPPPPPFLF